jgi:hypothetical protein
MDVVAHQSLAPFSKKAFQGNRRHFHSILCYTTAPLGTASVRIHHTLYANNMTTTEGLAVARTGSTSHHHQPGKKPATVLSTAI